MSRTSAQAQAWWAQRRAREAEKRCIPDTHSLPGRCRECGARVYLVDLRWVDAEVPRVHACGA